MPRNTLHFVHIIASVEGFGSVTTRLNAKLNCIMKLVEGIMASTECVFVLLLSVNEFGLEFWL